MWRRENPVNRGKMTRRTFGTRHRELVSETHRERNFILFQTSTLARHEKPEGEGQDTEGKRKVLTRSPIEGIFISRRSEEVGGRKEKAFQEWNEQTLLNKD